VWLFGSSNIPPIWLVLRDRTRFEIPARSASRTTRMCSDRREQAGSDGRAVAGLWSTPRN